MSEKINVDSGNPYRGDGGKFGTSPDQKLKDSFKALEGKKFVSRDDNQKRVKTAQKEAKAKLAALRNTTSSKYASEDNKFSKPYGKLDDKDRNVYADVNIPTLADIKESEGKDVANEISREAEKYNVLIAQTGDQGYQGDVPHRVYAKDKKSLSRYLEEALFMESGEYKIEAVSKPKDDNSLTLASTNAFTEDQQRQVDLATEQFRQSVERVDNQILAQYIQAIQNGDYTEAEAILENAEESQQTHTLVFALLTISAILLPLYAKQRINALFAQFGLHTVYAQTSSGQKAIRDQAEKGAVSHVRTIAKDIKKQLDEAIDAELTNQSIKAAMEAKYPKLKDSKNYLEDVKKDDDMYKFARNLALRGASRDEIIKKLQENFPELSKKRANVIAGNESNRVFTLSQFEADEQFLAQNKLTDKAYKRLVSNTGHPCPICASIIAATHVKPIPFKKDFAEFGKEMVVKYEEDGQEKTKKFTPNYEHLRSGHIHVNCHCRYELLIKRDDGTWLNSNTNKVENIPNFEPELHPRDKKGKFAKKGTTIAGNVLDVSKLGSKKAFDDFVEKSDMSYTKQQQFTAGRYQSPHGYAINEAYRLGSPTIKMNDDKLSASKFAEILDSAFNMTIPEESTLFRGVGDSPRDFVVGKNYVDRGYTSTTTVEDTARKKFKGPGGVVIHLTIPAGTKVAVPDIISGKTTLDEQEVLLSRGTSYSVYKIDGDIVYAVIV